MTRTPRERKRYHLKQIRLDIQESAVSITSKAFEDWAEAFSQLSAYRGVKAEREEGKEKTPIEDTLKKIEALANGDLSPKLLRKNVLYACYQADQTLRSGRDSGDERREEFKASFKALYAQRKTLAAVADLLAQHPEAVKVAISYFNVVSSKRTEHFSHQSVARLPGTLIDALRRVNDFSALYKANPRMVTGDMFNDCAEGPFMFFNRNDNRYRSSAKAFSNRRLVELGLIFHLTYLFRYFSSAPDQRETQSKLKGNGELAVEGRMISGGKNSYANIAHLLNALPKLRPTHSEKVKDDLAGLLNPNKLKKGKAALLIHVGSKEGEQAYVRCDLDSLAPSAFEEIEFIGWPQALA